MYLLALGFGLEPVFEKAGEGSYLQFVVPGVVAMAVLFSSYFREWACSGTVSSGS
jgi:ABC-2 type transport system permease protein